MLLHHDAELCFGEEIVTAAAEVVGDDPSSVDLMAFRTVWRSYES